MLKYEYINKEWIVSPVARRVYLASASLSVALFFSWWAILLAGGIPAPIAPVVRLLLFAGVVGAGISIVGMEFFLFRFDNSHPLKQIVWFFVLLFPLLGISTVLLRRVLALGCTEASLCQECGKSNTIARSGACKLLDDRR
jgi:hypothetical protein